MELNKRGGKRVGAGRKPVTNRKKVVTLYVPILEIVKFGNEEKFKIAVYEFSRNYGMSENKPIVAPVVLNDTMLPKTQEKPNLSPVAGQKVDYWDFFIKKKQECESEEDWREIKTQIENCQFLTQKQRDTIIKYA
jgi:RNase adaptor protein for sRNA GlmZ degradation